MSALTEDQQPDQGWPAALTLAELVGNMDELPEDLQGEVTQLLANADKIESDITAAEERRLAERDAEAERRFRASCREHDVRLKRQDEHEARLRTLPVSLSECTDLANAHRLLKAYGAELISVAGQFYVWSGTHWQRDETAAARRVMRLSEILRAEIEELEQQFSRLSAGNLQAAKTIAKIKRPDQSVEYAQLLEDQTTKALVTVHQKLGALRRWAREGEMTGRLGAAESLLRDLVSVDASNLDRDQWLLNCMNGVVDLRTGFFREHDPLDYITKLAPVEYDPDAPAPRFKRFVREIVGGDPETASFMQRWMGYCATGSVREQALAIFIGSGANGKSTLLNLVSGALGEYAGVAAPGLLAALSGGHDRHPTELADLQGRRLVSSSEIEDGAALREALVKQLTGGEPIKARRMHQDFTHFLPSHKLVLSTNHRPRVVGSDYGIWRRLLLVEFPIKYGTAQDVAEGQAARVRDETLEDALQAERAGILAWIVTGAIEWYRSGLQAPESVRLATREYQREQDRLDEFVRERCVLDPDAWSPFDGPMIGLYPVYVQWCRESGYQPLGKRRFSQELERVVPGFKRVEKKTAADGGGGRKSVYGCYGVRLDATL